MTLYERSNMNNRRPLLIFVVGPSAVGKSALALEAAHIAKSEILNMDSVQIYQRVDIGTAKPTQAEMARVPHHLVSVVPPGNTWTVGDFRREALRVLTERFQAGVDVLFAVGGSGFYVQALEKGLVEVPEIPEETRSGVEIDMEEKGLAALHAELTSRDPESAREISQNDSYRIKRALEIVRTLQGSEIPQSLTSLQTWSGLRQRFQTENSQDSWPFDILKIGIIRPRPQIRKAVEARAQKMLDLGFVEEVIKLREEGLARWAPMLSVGYREVQDMLDGRLPSTELRAAIVTKTMQLVKRQTTWFRRDTQPQHSSTRQTDSQINLQINPQIKLQTNPLEKPMHLGTGWFDVDEGIESPVEFAAEMIKQWRERRP